MWLGWFGFNAGSALGANSTAALAFVNTMLAPMATLVVWTVLDLWRNAKVTQHGEEAYSRGEGAILLLDRKPVKGVRAAERSVDLWVEQGSEP